MDAPSFSGPLIVGAADRRSRADAADPLGDVARLHIPVLKDAGEISTPFGQLVVAAGTIADFGAIILRA
jgi:hypothetical protein